MANLNLQIDLTKLPGAKVMDVQGNKSVRQCVVIPIDNNIGTVCNGYKMQQPDGSTVTKYFADVKLNLVAIEHRQKRNGISHGLKPFFSQEKADTMTEKDLFDIPWLGTVKPWGGIKDDVGDLPAGNENDW